MAIPKNYDHEAVESKWLTQWAPTLYRYGGGTTKARFIIDTPPPYPTGNFHLGNALNWCYIDFIARYKRMRGYDVLFPQGWDCHGLPTEVKVETTYNLTKNQIPRHEFRGLCESLTQENIALMKGTMQRMAFSIDWSHEFVTMNKQYYSKTQKSFLQMLRQGLIYKSEHPVNWCPRCETAIAFAEVEYEARSTDLYYVCFEGKDAGVVKIATTRPELLGACVAVAVHPDDARFAHLIGEVVRVPLYDDEVPIIADDGVDPTFGTGVVMICTFGDKQDVRWWKKHNLPLKKAIGKDGRLIDSRYSGLTINEAKERVIGDLLKRKFVYQQKLIEQNVGYHDRCRTPIEILSERQWFVKIDKLAIVRRASQIEWIPAYALGRLNDWTESVEWDWCISRQRIFATPIPVWYCTECKQVLVAEEEWLPVDPTEDTPRDACKCGSCSFTPETDVLDTWMDSSISALNVAGWPDESVFRKQFPTQLRPQGHDIIRTWAFYSILRADALVGQKPWERVVVNGMVLGEDSQKMSKSLGNIIAPESVITQYGTDVLRQWAAIGGSVGSDVAFNKNDLVAASRFLTKLWNVFRFSMIHIASSRCSPVVYGSQNPAEIWLLSRLCDLVTSVTTSMDRFAFDDALKEIRSFVWNVLADNYIEAAKGRLYNEDEFGIDALYRTLNAIARLLAPFCPFFAEELFSHLQSDSDSVHVQSWPSCRIVPASQAEQVVPQVSRADQVEHVLVTGTETELAAARQVGELVKDIISSVRHYKSERRIPLNARIEGLDIYSPHDLRSGLEDISSALNVDACFTQGDSDVHEEISEIKPNLASLGPRFKAEAKRIAQLISETPVEKLAHQIESGSFTIDTYTLNKDDLLVKREPVVRGQAVDVIELDKATIVIRKPRS